MDLKDIYRQANIRGAYKQLTGTTPDKEAEFKQKTAFMRNYDQEIPWLDELKQKAGEFLEQKVSTPMYNAGFENLGPEIGAVGQSVLDLLPSTTYDMAGLPPWMKAAKGARKGTGKLSAVVEGDKKLTQNELVVKAAKDHFEGRTYTDADRQALVDMKAAYRKQTGDATDEGYDAIEARYMETDGFEDPSPEGFIEFLKKTPETSSKLRGVRAVDDVGYGKEKAKREAQEQSDYEAMHDYNSSGETAESLDDFGQPPGTKLSMWDPAVIAREKSNEAMEKAAQVQGTLDLKKAMARGEIRDMNAPAAFSSNQSARSDKLEIALAKQRAADMAGEKASARKEFFRSLSNPNETVIEAKPGTKLKWEK